MPVDPRDIPMGEICPPNLKLFMNPAGCSVEPEANGVTWVAVDPGIQADVFRGLDKFEVEAWLRQWGWQSTSGGDDRGIEAGVYTCPTCRDTQHISARCRCREDDLLEPAGHYTCSFCGATCWSEDGCNCQILDDC